MNDAPIRVAAIRRVGGGSTADSDLIAVEEPLTIEVEHGAPDARARVNMGIVLRTPGRDEDLAAGLLFAEGFIRANTDITSITAPASGHLRVGLHPDVPISDRLAGRVLVRSSACGLCGRDAIDDLINAGAAPLPQGPSIREAALRALPAALRAHQRAFNETGGLHAAAFFDTAGRLLSSAEDIGRHNAVDKLVGAMLRTPGELGDQGPPVLVVSGRAAFEIVHKAVMARVPVLAAVGAPSSLAVETARAMNLTLAGFLREDRFNVYSGFDRIV